MNLHSFQLLTDENVDEEVLIFLRSQNLDVFDIKESGLFRMKDQAILSLEINVEPPFIILAENLGKNVRIRVRQL